MCLVFRLKTVKTELRLPVTCWAQVAEAHIKALQIVPDVDAKVIRLTVQGSGAARQASFKAVVTLKGKTIASEEGTVGRALEIAIPEPQLWSPENPFLYDLAVSLRPPSRQASSGLAAERPNNGSACFELQQIV